MEIMKLNDRRTERMILDTIRAWQTEKGMAVMDGPINFGETDKLKGLLVDVFKRRPHYAEIEFSWVADFNPKRRKIFISVGSVPAKHYVTCRYLFARTREFIRYPIPEMI